MDRFILFLGTAINIVCVIVCIIFPGCDSKFMLLVQAIIMIVVHSIGYYKVYLCPKRSFYPYLIGYGILMTTHFFSWILRAEISLINIFYQIISALVLSLSVFIDWTRYDIVVREERRMED